VALVKLDDPDPVKELHREALRYFAESRRRRNRADARFLAGGISCIVLFFGSLEPLIGALIDPEGKGLTTGLVMLFLAVCCGTYAFLADTNRLEQ
jgi:hypothetical protein